MNRFILTLLLLVVSGGAGADLTRVGESADYTAYADHETIRTYGSTVVMWDTLEGKTVKTIKKLRGATYRSQRTRMEYDCKGKRSRRLYYSLHSGPMASGVILYSSSGPFKWETAAPGSVARSMLEVACREGLG